jgi:hypothetical protein
MNNEKLNHAKRHALVYRKSCLPYAVMNPKRLLLARYISLSSKVIKSRIATERKWKNVFLFFQSRVYHHLNRVDHFFQGPRLEGILSSGIEIS